MSAYPRTVIVKTASTALAALLLGATAPRAQTAPSDCGLRIASGPSGKVYALMVNDIQAICGSEVSVCAVPSAGGLQNLSLLAANEGDLGIVQIDVLKEMGTDESIGALQAVMPLHVNLLHVIALSDGSHVGASSILGIVPFTSRRQTIQRFSELKGLRIAVVGTAQLMAQTLERQLGYGMTFLVADNDEQAIEMLRNGDVQAVFTLGGWPLPAVARLPSNRGLALVDYDLTPTGSYVKVKRSYQNLDAFNVNFLGSPNMLVSRPFKPGGAMGNKVSALQTCLKQHLDDLQEGRFQAGWKDIKDPNATYGFRAFGAKPPTGPASN
jgi:TRAP-type uncharacterized transport system substrate-binding protein